MARTVIPYILCKQHDHKCPNCGRFIHSLMTLCACGQRFSWEDHYKEFCILGNTVERCRVIQTKGRRTCSYHGGKIEKGTYILEVGRRESTVNICLACLEHLGTIVRDKEALK